MHDLNLGLISLLHTQSIVCAKVQGQRLEYLGYITLLALTILPKVSRNSKFASFTIT